MADENDAPRAFDLGNLDAADLPMPSDEAGKYETEDTSSPDFSELQTEGDIRKDKSTETVIPEPKSPVETTEPAKEEKVPETKPEVTTGKESEKKPVIPEEEDADLKAELDAIKIKANTPEKIKSDIAKVRAIAERERKAVKAEKARVAEIQTQLEEAKKAPVVDENLSKKIKELEEFKAKIQYADDREVRKQYDTKKTESGDTIFKLLKGVGLKEEQEADMRKVGLQSYSAEWWKTQILDPIAAKDPFKAREVENAVLAWMKVDEERDNELQKFVQNREEYYKQNETRAQEWWQKWGSSVEKDVLSMTKDQEWAKPKEVPANATPAKKAEIEAWNQQLEAKKTEFGQFVDKLAAVDAPTVAKAAFGYFHSQQLQTEKTTLQKQYDEALSTIKQLEEDLAKRNQAGRNSHRTSIATAKDAKKATHQGGEVSLEDAWKEQGMDD